MDWLEQRASLTPRKKAMIDEENNKIWTYSELNGRASATANWLYSRGVRKGDRVALLSPNHISYFDLLFACGKIGAIFVPLNWRLSQYELSIILADCTPILIGIHQQFETLTPLLTNEGLSSFLVGEESYETIVSYPAKMAVMEPILETDALAMIYTGGTTGKSKGVVLSHRAVLWNAVNTIVSWSLSMDDTTITYLPMFHTGGLNALSLPILMAGGTVVIGDSFSGAKAVESLQRYRCTIVLLVPTMYHSLIHSKEFEASVFPDMKVFLSGAAPCPLQIYEAFYKKGLAFKEGYGLTEAGPNNFYISPKEAEIKRGSVGKPMLFNAIKLIKSEGSEARTNEVGEILIKGKHSFSFYWNQEQATQETVKDGWIYTGDLAKRDEDGYFYIVGRKKDMIISGGENVYPLEIEHWLAGHLEINEAAVIGLPDEKWGERVTAFISLKNPIEDDELKRYCESKLGSYKIPKQFIRLKELPKTHVGKIDKNKLKEIGMKGRT